MISLKDKSNEEVLELINNGITPLINKKDYQQINNIMTFLFSEIKNQPNLSRKYSNAIKYYNNKVLLYLIRNNTLKDDSLLANISTIISLCKYSIGRGFYSDIIDALEAQERILLKELEKEKKSNLGEYGHYLIWRDQFYKAINNPVIKQTMAKIDLDSINNVDNYKFYFSFFYQILKKIDISQVKLSIEDINSFYNLISNNDWYLQLIDKSNKTKEEIEFISLYGSIILKSMGLLEESIFVKDKLISNFLEYKIDDPELIELCIDITSSDIILSSVKRTEKDVYYALYYNLKYIGNVKETLIKYYMASYMNKFDNAGFFSTFFINHMAIKDEKRMKKEFPWITYQPINKHFNDMMKRIKWGNELIMDVNFILHLIYNYEEFGGTRNFEDSNAGANLITLIQTEDYYSEKDISKIAYALKSRHFLKKYNSRIPTFKDKDSDFNRNKKAEAYFYTKEIMPYNVAVAMLEDQINGQSKISLTALKAIVISIICHTLENTGININNHIFFYYNNEHLGAHINSNNRNTIYINEIALFKFLKYYQNNKNGDVLEAINLFEIIFHELSHALNSVAARKNIQNIEQYVELKEMIIRELCPGYYDSNYNQLSIETNARINGASLTMKFLESVSPSTAIQVQEAILKKEQADRALRNSQDRKSPLIRNSVIDLNSLFEAIMKTHPWLVMEYPILLLEYNRDGSKKTLIDTFNFVKDNYRFYNILLDYVSYFNIKYDQLLLDFLYYDFKNGDLNQLKDWILNNRIMSNIDNIDNKDVQTKIIYYNSEIGKGERL